MSYYVTGRLGYVMERVKLDIQIRVKLHTYTLFSLILGLDDSNLKNSVKERSLIQLHIYSFHHTCALRLHESFY